MLLIIFLLVGNQQFDAAFTVEAVKLQSQSVVIEQMSGPPDGVNPPSNPTQYSPVMTTMTLSVPVGATPVLSII